MNRSLNLLRWLSGATLLGGALALGTLGLVNLAQGSGGEYEDDERHEKAFYTAVAVDPLYSEECGACHLAYPPTLLPARSWQTLMAQLDDHFNENAELPPALTAKIEAYLTDHAAGSGPRKGKNFLRGMEDQAPLRITQLPGFKHEHDEIPMQRVQDNSEVGSFSRCEACHQSVETRGFDEDNVTIPGYGHWDD